MLSRHHSGLQTLLENTEHVRPPRYRSFPAYERLKLLLMSGKSGTMFPTTAHWIAGQFMKEGSRTLQRWIRPFSPAMTKYRISPRQPSTAERAHSPGCGTRSGAAM